MGCFRTTTSLFLIKKQEIVERETPTRVSTKRQKNWLKKCFYSEKVLSQEKITCSFEVVVVDYLYACEGLQVL
jgi:hypothetical protein